MSVCTGAFVLAHAGLLAGKHATTHHDFHDQFQAQFPDVTLERAARFVESASNVATAGGLTSGSTSRCTSSSATSAATSRSARPATWSTRARAG